MRRDSPILFLDSGVGGLSVLDAVAAHLPMAPIVYCADAAGFPYGTKSEAEVSARVAGLLGRLVERLRPRLAVIACNTASTIALAYVRGVIGNLPVVGTVPAIKPAAEATRTGVIGVLGTEATVRQPYVDELSAAHAAHVTVIRHGSAELVEAAEARLAGRRVDARVFEAALAGLLDQPGGAAIDQVVLACTHFPLVEAELAAAAPRALAFVHGAQGIARRVATLTAGQDWPATRPAGRLVATGPLDPLAPLAPAFHKRGLNRWEQL